MNLDELIRETAIYLGETLNIEDGQFVEIDKINKIKIGLNQAYRKVANKIGIDKVLEIENNYILDDSIGSIKDIRINNRSIDFDITANTITFNYPTATLIYEYVPPDLVSLSDIPLLGYKVFDHKILCFYSAYMYSVIDEEPENAQKWLGIWENEFKKIRTNRIRSNKIKRMSVM